MSSTAPPSTPRDQPTEPDTTSGSAYRANAHREKKEGNQRDGEPAGGRRRRKRRSSKRRKSRKSKRKRRRKRKSTKKKRRRRRR